MEFDYKNLSLIEKAKFLEDFISKFEPFTLINIIAGLDSFKNLRLDKSDITGMSFMIPEYVSLLLLKTPYPTVKEFNTNPHTLFPDIRQLSDYIQLFLKDVIEDALNKINVQDGLSELEKLATTYFIQEFYLRNPVPNFLHKKVISAIYEPFNDKLYGGIGFDCDDALTFTDSVISLLDLIKADKAKTLKKQIREIIGGKPMSESMTYQMKQIPDDFNFNTFQEKVTYAYNLYEGILNRQTYVFTKDQIINHSELDENTTEKCLDAFSAKFGDVPSDFYIPNSIHLLRKKPLIKNQNEYTLPSTPLLSWSIEQKLDEYLLSKDKKFTTKRHDAVVNLACESLKKVFVDAEVYTHLSYENYSHELDALILVDCVAIIIECKANRITDQAKVGRKDRIETHLKDLVKKSHEQSTSAINFLKSADIVEFRCNSKPIKINTEKIKKFYPITLTLEPLSSLGVLIKKVNDLGIAAKSFPWIISIYDLLIICEHNPFPSVFFHYIERRNEFASYPNLWGHDEIDLFSLYMQFGLDIGSLDIPNDHTVMFSHSSEHINSYYVYKSGVGKYIGKLPILLKTKFIELLKDIEHSETENWAYINVALLNLNERQKDELISYIDLTDKKHKRDKDMHDFSLSIQNLNCGLTYIICHNTNDLINTLDSFCQRKIREFTPAFWIGIGKSKQKSFAKLFFNTSVY